jgi:hypothetical protein
LKYFIFDLLSCFFEFWICVSCIPCAWKLHLLGISGNSKFIGSCGLLAFSFRGVPMNSNNDMPA